MRYLFLFLPFLLLFACKEDLPNPCGETGYTLTENGCECVLPARSAYGTCRELRKDEWYGITSGCPCEDTLFVQLGELRPNGWIDIRVNADIDQGQFAEGTTPWRVVEQYNNNAYYPSSEGDSLGYGGFGSGFLSCPLEFDIPAFQYTTFRGRFTPDRSAFNGHLYYHWGNRQNQIIDSCAIRLSR